MSLNLPTFYLWYCSQLVLCEQGVGEICLDFSLPPEISLPCDGDSLGQSTCASHLIPLIYHRVSLRNRRISLSATVAPQFAPANSNKVKPRANVLGLKGKVGHYRAINSWLFTTTQPCLLQNPFFFSFFSVLAHFRYTWLVTVTVNLVAQQHRALVCVMSVMYN